MTAISAETEPDSTWHRACRYLQRLRDWPANGNSPYSPLFCISLLLGVVLIIETGR